MDDKRKMMHKLLDGEASEEDKKTIVTDHELDEEFSGLLHAVRTLEESEQREPPMFFTAEVMKKLPKAKPAFLDRIRGFFFTSRVVRWNMASALSLAVIVLVSLVLVSRMRQQPAINAAGQPDQTITVRLTFNSPQARRVSVAGDFNKWKTDANEMKKADGKWSIDLKLKPGVYSYSFVVDGKSWVPDPGAESYNDDGFGSRNAVLKVDI